MTPPGRAEVEHRFADLGDVRLHYVEAGADDGPVVVLLHGFPEFWWSWRSQIPALAGAGFRVVALDMRGYNLSDKPVGVESYRVEALADDVARLILHLGYERAAVVGHDWGGIVAWVLAMRRPETVERLTILNVPHPAVFPLGLRMPRQLLKSWYVFALQVPGLPGRLVEKGVFAYAKASFRRDPSRPGTFSEADIERYGAAMGQDGALTAAANYYRALLRWPLRTRRLLRRIEAPVLVIWGEKDRYLRPELAKPDPAWVPNARVERLPHASHWVQQDRPEEVNDLLLGFLLPRRG